MNPLGTGTRRRLIDGALIDLACARRLLGPSLGLITDSLAGYPQAARYDGSTTDSTSRLWCFTHECDHRRCQYDGLTCGGTPVTGHDPTGDAATSVDTAAEARASIDRAIATLADAASTLATTMTAWAPASTDMQRPDPASITAPDGWCTSCWRNNRHEQGVSPHYRGLCQWCGRFLASEGYLPPVQVLQKHHDPYVHVTEADVARWRPAGHRQNVR